MANSHADRRRPETSAKSNACKRRERASITTIQTAGGAGRILITDLPDSLLVDKRELALWRAFLADEIEAILLDGG